jgi:hypothetical protein
MALHKTKDNFVWLDITDRCNKGEKTIQELWLSQELYAVFDDDSDTLLESIEEIEEALILDLRICIEVGHLPEESKQKTRWWHKADKKIINGYFYVKYNDIKFGSV